MYEYAGGERAFRRLAEAFHANVLADPLLRPLFTPSNPQHADHLAAWLGEVFGGPKRYSETLGGFPTMLASHRDRRLTEEQRLRFVSIMAASLEDAGLPSDNGLREGIIAYVDWGSGIAVHNSWPGELHPCQEVPTWDWGPSQDG